VTKPSRQGVAVRSPKRHAFVVDQREWDYGVRLPRDRGAAESWSLDKGPESTESGDNPPKWQSITDTGSLEPSPEAVAWSLRADQWAQQPNLPERQQQGQWDGQVSRWSEVVPTGNSPADGVGWRTETAEWRATSARWRQTTEWRSSSGSHGWRSTTEAWQTGDSNAEGFPPPAAPPTGGPLAISGTAWSGETADDQSGGAQESWQQSDGSYRTESYAPPSAAGQSQPADSRPSWQAFATPTPPWQQPAPAPPWQQPGGPSWQQAAPSPPPWEQPARQPIGGPWQQLVGPDDGRHLVREDDRAQWRQSAAGAAGLQDPSGQVGRRRASEGGGARAGGGTGWSTRSDADNWAGHTDTGSMPLFQDQAPSAGTAWPERTEPPSWRTEGRAASETPDWRPRGDTTGWRDTQTPGRPDAPDWRRQSDTPSWRREDDGGSRRADGEPRDWGNRRDEPDAPDWRTQTSTSGWRTDGRAETDAPGWRTEGRAETDAPGWRTEGRAGADAPSWRDEPRADGRARAAAPDWRREPERDDYRREPDSGSWSRDEEPHTDGWRRSETPSRRRDQQDWRRDEPASDPWAHSSADTGVIPTSWQPPATDTGSWRTPAPEAEPYAPPRRREQDPYGRRTQIERYEDPYGRRAEIEAGPYAPSRRRAEIEPEEDDDDWEDDDPAPGGPIGPEMWRQDPEPRRERGNWRMEPLDDARTQAWRRELQEEQGLPAGEAPTEIRAPIDWQQAERDEAARGAASYREGNTGDWRLELAAETEMVDGESRRYGTSDFVPFTPSGAAGTASVPAARPAADDEMVVGNRTGNGRWQDPPDTQWPPRPATDYDSVATGSYERRPVSTLPNATGRQTNLLEPDDDEIEESNGGPLAAVGYTVIWYGVPVVLFVLYMLVLNGSQQAHALSTLAGAAPQFGLSLVLSMLVAVGLRWASGSWKSASVGLAAAVMGGGLATVLTSAITGNSLS
jgi:hypothetical protein